MTTRMIANQRRAFLAGAQDDARRLASSLANLSDAERVALLAVLAAATSTPLDAIFMTSEPGDREQLDAILTGVLLRGPQPDSYDLGNGCLLLVVPQPGTETTHE